MRVVCAGDRRPPHAFKATASPHSLQTTTTTTHHAARLRDGDDAAAVEPGLEQDLRQLRRLARARLADDDDHVVVAHGLDDLGGVAADGQVGHIHHLLFDVFEDTRRLRRLQEAGEAI